ncbi:MAG: lipid-binding SYLF domain-containing protein [Alphaproteobacteria bacterium]|nr:MAG: lipid-binding SYLF domain-containing protein [Alphaproteobacteria bacterium]
MNQSRKIVSLAVAAAVSCMAMALPSASAQNGGAIETAPLTPPGDLGKAQPIDGSDVSSPVVAPSPPYSVTVPVSSNGTEAAGVAATTSLTDQAELITRAKVTAESMFSDPNYPALLNLTMRARAVLVVPNLFRVGFFIGGRGGNGVLVVRDPSTKQWGTPAFYALGGVSYGLQFGAQDSEVILVIMSEKGLRALVKNEVTLGGDAGMAVANVGMGAQAATGLGMNADVYSFARSGGLYAGVALDGSVITAKDSWNKEVYGPGATPEAILLERRFPVPEVTRPLVSILP